MELIVVLAVLSGIGWWLFKPKKSASAARATVAAPPPPPRYEDYQDELERKPIDELNEDEKIIRRAHDAFHAERDARTAEYGAKQNSLADDNRKIKKATDFIETSYLSLALPFVQEKTQHWPSWSKMHASRWTAPIPLSDVNGPEGGTFEDRRVEFRADGGPLYRIAFQKSRMPVDDDQEYGTMTLAVDGEQVLGMFVSRNWQKEYDDWKFAVVDNLKVGPWIEGFIAFYNRLRNIDENAQEDTSNNYVRQKAAKIDLGDL